MSHMSVMLDDILAQLGEIGGMSPATASAQPHPPQQQSQQPRPAQQPPRSNQGQTDSQPAGGAQPSPQQRPVQPLFYPSASAIVSTPPQSSGGDPFAALPTWEAQLKALDSNMNGEVDSFIQDLEAFGAGAVKELTSNTEFEPWYCKFSELNIGRRLGIGTFGTSYQGILRERSVTIKKLNVSLTAEPTILEPLKEEALILSAVKHPNLVEFLSLCCDTELCTVQEFINGLPVFGYTRNPENVYDIEWIIKVAKDIAMAMAHLHKNNIIHMDLKTKNILVDRYQVARVSDYGIHTLKKHCMKNPHFNRNPEYSAPEVFTEGAIITNKVDVYSYGIILWELFAKVPPFAGKSPEEIIKAVVEENARPPVPMCPYAFSRLIESCWHADPLKRPPFEIILKIFNQAKEHLLRFDQINPGSSEKESETLVIDENPMEDENLTPEEREKRNLSIIARIAEKLKIPGQEFQLKTLKALVTFASNCDARGKEMIISSAIMLIVMPLGRSKDELLRENALRLLFTLAENEDLATQLLLLDDCLDILVESLYVDLNPAIIREALKAITKIAVTYDNQEKLGVAGAVTQLVALLSHSNEMVQFQAASVLAGLLPLTSIQLDLYRCNGVQPILQLLASANSPMKLNLLSCLGSLANNSKMETIIIRTQALKFYIPFLQGESPMLKVNCLKSLEQFAERQVLRKDIFRHGLMELLLAIYTGPNKDHDELLTRNAKVLALLASEPEHCNVTASGGLVPIVAALRRGDREVRFHTIRCILALLQKEENRASMIGTGSVATLIAALGHDAELLNKGLEIIHLLSLDDSNLEVLGNSGVVTLITDEKLLTKPEGDDDEEEDNQFRASIRLGEDSFIPEEEKQKLLAKENLVLAVKVLRHLSSCEPVKDFLRTGQAIVPLIKLINPIIPSAVSVNAIIAICSVTNVEKCRDAILAAEGLTPILLTLANSSDSIVLERAIWAAANFAADEKSHKAIRDIGVTSIVNLLATPDVTLQTLALKTILLLIKNSGPNIQAINEAGGIAMLSIVADGAGSTLGQAARRAIDLLQGQ